MKRFRTTTSSYPYSSYYNHNLWNFFEFGVEESSIQDKKTTKTHPKIVQRENGRCEICYQIEKKKMKLSLEPQNVKEEVMEKNVTVIIDENEEKNVIKGNKMDVIMEENVVLGMDKEVKRKKLEETKVENGEVEEGKIVIIDEGIDMEALLGYSEGEESGDGGKVVGDLIEVKNNEDMFSGEEFPSWNEWKFEIEQEWCCSYPFWETQNGAFNFWDIEPSTNDWVVSLWNL
ncbi:hypothetical protein Lal_00040320 [Lupinus albus]|uniref:Uncharacterized protein n=1 Tax=Lupinus albus TaxID=3870 RepID=A0A6A5MS17_LUPAL|nr:hypothetical protein Lalb_Chr02g0159051 [Lupinus albus]KAF1877604.1 hypothetical protein Lal_00040320 [Lupinus albus]